jgi:hypothetical protein
MGRWGEGNFHDDTARDYLNAVVARFEGSIERVLTGDYPEEATDSSLQEVGESFLVPTVEIIIVLHEHLGSEYLPRPETVARWSRDYPDELEQAILQNDPVILTWYREERRPVIADTFNRLLTLSEKVWKDEGDVDWRVSSKSDT